MIKVCCFYLSKPFRSKQFAKVYPENENVIETFEPTIIRHISILEKKKCGSQESNQTRKPSIFTFE